MRRQMDACQAVLVGNQQSRKFVASTNHFPLLAEWSERVGGRVCIVRRHSDGSHSQQGVSAGGRGSPAFPLWGVSHTGCQHCKKQIQRGRWNLLEKYSNINRFLQVADSISCLCLWLWLWFLLERWIDSELHALFSLYALDNIIVYTHTTRTILTSSNAVAPLYRPWDVRQDQLVAGWSSCLSAPQAMLPLAPDTHKLPVTGFPALRYECTLVCCI